MRKYLIGRDRTLYGWNPEMAKQDDLYEIDLDATTADEFEFPDSDNAIAAQARVYPTAVGDTADEAAAEAQRKAAAGEPFVTRHASTITLVKDPAALLDMKPLASPHSLTQASDMDPRPEQDAAGNLKPEFKPNADRAPQEDPRPGENAAILRSKGVSDRDQGKPEDDLSDEDRERAAADRKARAQKIIDEAKSKKRGPHPDNSLPGDER